MNESETKHCKTTKRRTEITTKITINTLYTYSHYLFTFVHCTVHTHTPCASLGSAVDSIKEIKYKIHQQYCHFSIYIHECLCLCMANA